jgi:ATPase subunit of ABC transporter with duplicated ATPase domains
MNGVCTNIVRMHQKHLWYYSGNYDTYMQTREVSVLGAAFMQKHMMRRSSGVEHSVSRRSAGCCHRSKWALCRRDGMGWA